MFICHKKQFIMKLLYAALPLLVLTFSACHEDFDSRLQRESIEYTKNNCPETVEPGTVLDSVTYSPKQRTYTLWYRLTAENSQILQDNTPLLHQTLLQKLVNDVNYKALKDEGINFSYVYRTNRTIIYQTIITKNEYCKY